MLSGNVERKEEHNLGNQRKEPLWLDTVCKQDKASVLRPPAHRSDQGFGHSLLSL